MHWGGFAPGGFGAAGGWFTPQGFGYGGAGFSLWGFGAPGGYGAATGFGGTYPILPPHSGGTYMNAFGMGSGFSSW